MSTSQRPRLLVVQTGTAGALAAEHGDYPAWFSRALGRELPAVRAFAGEKLDAAALDRHRPDGILVSGSPLSVTAHAPWMRELGDALLKLGAGGTPVLGVCFGHQLLGWVAGGDVVRNPRGREIGTISMQLTPEGRRDPLFAWADGPELEALATHVDAVAPLPRGAIVLAQNENTPVQAFRLSETIAGVQFHPEMTPAAMRALIASRRTALAEEALDADERIAQVRDVRAGAILAAFDEQCSRA